MDPNVITDVKGVGFGTSRPRHRGAVYWPLLNRRPVDRTGLVATLRYFMYPSNVWSKCVPMFRAIKYGVAGTY